MPPNELPLTNRLHRALVVMAGYKYRIRFAKSGDLRLVSHHDLMRCFERMLRRSGLPFASTKGFNPKPRLVFGLSLGLGMVGRDEVVELEMLEEVPAGELRERLARQAPEGLELHHVRAIDPRAKARVCEAVYRVPVPIALRENSQSRIETVMSASSCYVERAGPARRRIDLKSYLRDLRVDEFGLTIAIAVSPAGTVRPQEVLQAIGLEGLLEGDHVIERWKLQLTDEMESGSIPASEPLETGDDQSVPPCLDVGATCH